ncbi:MAG: RRXRR domain-containing protein, partial [Desulfovibrionaceae bacterium]|nr:RRXRR domain-containing protein [Desulfovibrionaceae bacterium]
DHVRRLLKNKLAKVVSVKPFQIQLLYKEKEIYESPREKNVLGIDPGVSAHGSTELCGSRFTTLPSMRHFVGTDAIFRWRDT